MIEGAGAFSAVFGAVGLLFALAGTAMFVHLLRATARRSRVLATGLAVEARCLDTFTESSSEGSSSRYAILGFTTREGLDVRIKTPAGGTMVVGDFVAVRYAPDHPEQAVPVPVGADRALNGCGTVAGLVFCAVFTLVGLAFAGAGFGVWDLLSQFTGATSSVPDPGSYVPDPGSYVPDPGYVG